MEEANRVGWECLEKGLEGRSRKVSKISFTICPVLKSKLTGSLQPWAGAALLLGLIHTLGGHYWAILEQFTEPSERYPVP